MQLTDGATTVSLPDNVLWRDEISWEPVAQATERTLTGALVTDESARTGGRPITLTGMWVARAVVDKLETLRANVATDMTLTLPGGSTRTVAWRRGDGPAVESALLFPDAPDVITAATLYTLTLRLMET